MQAIREIAESFGSEVVILKHDLVDRGVAPQCRSKVRQSSISDIAFVEIKFSESRIQGKGSAEQMEDGDWHAGVINFIPPSLAVVMA